MTHYVCDEFIFLSGILALLILSVLYEMTPPGLGVTSADGPFGLIRGIHRRPVQSGGIPVAAPELRVDLSLRTQPQWDHGEGEKGDQQVLT